MVFDYANLTGWSLVNQNLTGASFLGSNLTGVNLAGATVAQDNFAISGLTADQLYSTASYLAKDLHGISLNGVMNQWNLAGQNLSGSSISGYLRGANLAGANLVGANLTGSNLTDTNLSGVILTGANLSSTSGLGVQTSGLGARAAVINLTGPSVITLLTNANLSGANLAGVNFSNSNLDEATLTDANFMGANLSSTSLTKTNLSRADMRGALGASVSDALTHNTILPNGSIAGLNLAAGERLTIQNSAANIPIHVSSQMTLDPTASLHVVIDDQPWHSTISFDSGMSVSLAGNLDLTIASSVLPSSLVGDTFQLFDWSGISHTGQFQFVTDPGYVWNSSALYTTGQVTLMGVPEPSTLVLLGAAAISLLGFVWRRRKRVA